MKHLIKRAAALFVTLLLVVCTGTSALSNAAAGTEPVTVTFWHIWTADWEKVINDAVAVFEKENPGILVDALPVPGVSNEKFMAAVAANEAPDVFKTNGRYSKWAYQDAIMPLDDYIAAKTPGLLDWMYPAVAESCIVNGKVYGIPMSMDTFMMWYNKTLLDEAGIDPATLPSSLEEFDVLQKKLWKFDDNGNITQVGFWPKDSDYMTWMAQFGTKPLSGDKIDVLQPKVIETIKWYESYATSMGIDPLKVAAFTQANDGGDDSNSLYAKGLCAFWVDGMWVVEVVEEFSPQFEYGAIPVPAPAGGAYNSTGIDANFMVMPKGSKNPQEAFQFMAWFSGYKAEETIAGILSLGGWIPISPEIAKTATYQDYLNDRPVRKIFVDALLNPASVAYPNISYVDFFHTKMKNAIERVQMKQQTTEQSMEDLQVELDDEAKG